MSNSRKLTIYFIDETSVNFRFPEQDIDERTMSKTLDRVLNQQVLILEGDDTVYFFPYNNIKYIKMTPSSKKLPYGTIQGVQLLD